jgi:hypothetical protein
MSLQANWNVEIPPDMVQVGRALGFLQRYGRQRAASTHVLGCV